LSSCNETIRKDDYIEVSRLYQTVLVSNVPRFDAALENQARVLSRWSTSSTTDASSSSSLAATPVGELYSGERLRHEILRTQSRLEEMQSHDYLAQAHRP
jgi:cell division protein ZapE